MYVMYNKASLIGQDRYPLRFIILLPVITKSFLLLFLLRLSILSHLVARLLPAQGLLPVARPWGHGNLEQRQ